MKNRHSNKDKQRKLAEVSGKLSAEEVNRIKLNKSLDNLSFSFEYFSHSKDNGEDFCEWEYDHLVSLLKKLVEYSKKSKKSWIAESKIFVEYGDWRNTFNFKHPQNIPRTGVKWERCV